MVAPSSIGAASRDAGVRVPTIRYYESIGLLPEPERTASNRRVYSDGDVRRLRFIRHARELGFDIEAIRELLRFADEPSGSCDLADVITSHHIAALDQRIGQLTALRAELTRMVDQCKHDRVSDCRIMEVLSDHGQCSDDHHGTRLSQWQGQAG